PCAAGWRVLGPTTTGPARSSGASAWATCAGRARAPRPTRRRRTGAARAAGAHRNNMADEAKFSLRLIDRVSGAALGVRKALGRIAGEARAVSSAAAETSRVVGKTLNKDLRRFTKQGTFARKVLGKLGPALDRTFGTSLRKNMGAASEKAQAMWKHVAGGHIAAKVLMAVADFAGGAANAG